MPDIWPLQSRLGDVTADLALKPLGYRISAEAVLALLRARGTVKPTRGPCPAGPTKEQKRESGRAHL